MRFRDLVRQYEILKVQIDKQIAEVIKSAHFISGEQVKLLEKQLADYVGVKHCITCGNGTDAITLALMTWGIGEGDAVFVPDFTFFSSGECPALVGATPVFVDVDERTYNIDPDKLKDAIEKVISDGIYKPRAVITVDLFGLPANYNAIKPLCKKYNLLLLEDGAQGFGGSIKGKMACSFGDISTTSFFPAKPLGCYGDGGAVFTDNDEWAALLRSFAIHGKSGNDKYNNIRIGMNSRLDTLQAAILIPKLEAFKKNELKAVNNVAKFYTSELDNTDLVLPIVKQGYRSSWAQFTIQLPYYIDRVILQQKLRKRGIPTMVYYTKPMHLQGAFEGTYSESADCPITEKLCQTVLSLPIHPYITEDELKKITHTLKNAIYKSQKDGGL